MSAAAQLSRRDKVLIHCAPIRDDHIDDRGLRTAVHHARKTEAFAVQQTFDKAVSALVQAIPIPKEITDWVPTESFIAPPRRTWKKYAQNPVFLATGIAAIVIESGSLGLTQALGLPQYLGDVVQAVILLTMLASLLLTNYRLRYRPK